MSDSIDPQLITKERVTINNSSAKQMYSFGKASRFKNHKITNEKFFYDIPTKFEKRAAGVGIGSKSDFTSGLMKGKTDNYYDIPREFDVFRRQTPQYSFGRGRDICKMQSELGRDKNPGPGTYNPYKKLGHDALKFSLFGRDWSKPKRVQTEPGPGEYKYLNINSEGKYSSSLFKNSPSPGFSSYKSIRFKYFDYKYPPPNAYFREDKQNLMNGTGYYFSTKYNSRLAKTFGSKLFVKNPAQRQAFPGPGTYETFSCFNGFTKAARQNKMAQSQKNFRKKNKLLENSKRDESIKSNKEENKSLRSSQKRVETVG